MPDNDTVKLRTAYCWDCPRCKRVNFADAQEVPIDRDDPEFMAQAREFFDLDEYEDVPDGSLCTNPDEVTCAACGVTFFAHRGELDDPMGN